MHILILTLIFNRDLHALGFADIANKAEWNENVAYVNLVSTVNGPLYYGHCLPY